MVKAELNTLLEMGIVRSSSSVWSPLHVVAKPSGDWRACSNYRAHNAISENDRYPLPHLQEFAAKLDSACSFSRVDLLRAYNQLPMKSEVIAKTASVTPFGLFKYLHMPFGLKNTAQTFQRFTDNVFRD